MLTLVDIDLAKHKRDVSHEPRDSRGRWTRGGAHLPLVGETRFQIEERDAKEIAGAIAALTEKAHAMDPHSTEYEHTWAQINARLEEMHKYARKAHEHHHGQAEAKSLTLENAPKPVKKAADVGKEFGEVTSTTALAGVAIHAGVAASSAAGAMLGASQSEAFTEAFNRLAENPMAEAGVIVAVTLLLQALFTAIKKALAKRRKARIEAARGVQPA